MTVRFPEKKMKLQGLRSHSGPWMAAAPVEGQGRVTGACSLHVQPHAEKDGGARRQHGFGAQRRRAPGLGRWVARDGSMSP